MRKLVLSILMLGVLLAIVGSVSAAPTCTDINGKEVTCPNDCTVNVIEPMAGQPYDPVTIKWDFSGDCVPSTYTLQYQIGNYNCNGLVWKNIADGIPSDEIPMIFSDWQPTQDGKYCVRVRMNQARGPFVSGYSGMFNVDLTAPVLTISAGSPKVIDNGNTYVNQQTPITLSCTDDGTYDSGVDHIEYTINDGNTITVNGDTTTFTFSEDSQHVVDAKCFDKVGKSDTQAKTFIVDTVAPVVDRVVGEPNVPTDGGYYVNQDTQICVSASNGENEPHPVPGDISVQCTSNDKKITLDENGCFYYSEDSQHTLNCAASDALGNSGSQTWNDIVDTVAPQINVVVNDPKFPSQIEGFDWYVSTATDVCVSAMNGVDEPHPVPGDITLQCTSNDNPITLDENGCFKFGEESQHTLDCAASDALNNKKELTKGLIVDDTAPTTTKTVEKPNHKCTEGDSKCQDGWDWIVTTNTDITLSCADNLPHPSGIAGTDYSGIYYRITLDGTPQDWQFANSNSAIVHFNEESEHLLEFYCVDNVNKKSDTDSEMFKVEGEQVTIPLYKKWNLISIPISLLSNDVNEVFNQISDKVSIVWSYDNGTWHVYSPEGPSDLTTIDPGYGYWVKAKENTTLVVGGSLLSPAPGVPPSRSLDKGWNLIGHYGTEPKSAYCSLFSLVDTNIGFPRWSALNGYDGASQKFFSLNAMNPSDMTTPGKGYWIEMDTPDTYSPATTCWGFP
jgi:hypothetical protein